MKGDKVDKRCIKEVRIVALIAEDASTVVQPDRRSVDPLVSASSPAATSSSSTAIGAKVDFELDENIYEMLGAGNVHKHSGLAPNRNNE